MTREKKIKNDDLFALSIFFGDDALLTGTGYI